MTKIKYGPMNKDSFLGFPMGLSKKLPAQDKDGWWIVHDDFASIHFQSRYHHEIIDPAGRVVDSGKWLMTTFRKGDKFKIVSVLPPRSKFSTKEINAARKTTTVTVCDEHTKRDLVYSGSSYADGSLNKIIKSLEKVRDSVPKEFRAKTRCHFTTHSSYGETYEHVEVNYPRPETDSEVVDRLKIELIDRAIAERNERAKLSALQEKYASPS